MLLQLRKHDGSTEEIEVLRGPFAREITISFDWEAEQRRFELLAESEGDAYFPSIAFTDNAGRTLEIGPNSDDTFWICYRYSIMKSRFGFCLTNHEREQQLEACELKVALGFLDRHYGGKHLEIVSELPAQQPSDDAKD